jgi:hypothetical protein
MARWHRNICQANVMARARKRSAAAHQIVNHAHGKLMRLVEAKMGVMQINPKGSSATSSEGNNDTTRYEKEISAVVTTTFELR